MYDFLDTSTPNSGLGTALRAGGEIINANFRKLHMWMESRSNIASSPIPTLAAGGPAYLLASSFTPGNAMPLTLYERTSTPPTDVTNPAWVQSTDLQWWKLRPQAETVYIEQFGGKADYPGSGTSGTDNHGPLMKAIAFTSGLLGTSTYIGLAPYAIKLGSGRYKFSQTVLLHNIVNIQGSFIGPDFAGAGDATQLWFTNTTGSGFVLFSGNSGPGENDGQYTPTGELHSAGGSYLGGFSWHGTWVNPTPMDQSEPFRSAIRIRCGGVKLDRISIHNAPGHGFFIHGAVSAGASFPFYGNANQCFGNNCWVQSCAGHALFLAGNDANASTFVNFQAETAGGCGILDGSALGCAFEGGKIATYGRGIHKSGKRYQYLGPTNFADPGSVVPGTNDNIWHYIGDGGSNIDVYPDWDTMTDLEKSQYWLVKCPIYISNSLTSMSGMYNELGPVSCYTNSRNILGGIIAWTRNSAVNAAIEFRMGFTGTSGTAFDENGEDVYVKYGGSLNTNTGDYAGVSMRIFTVGRGVDGGGVTTNFGYHGASSANSDILLTSNGFSTELLRITTPSTTSKLGGQIEKPHKLALTTPFIGDITTGAVSYRQRCFCDGTPSVAGEYIRGNKYDYLNPTAGGAEGVVVTTSGAIAHSVWGAGFWPSNFIASTTAGRRYYTKAGGTSTVEPTHTSGTVTVGGVTWVWVSNGPPAFKEFGSITA